MLDWVGMLGSQLPEEQFLAIKALRNLSVARHQQLADGESESVR